MDIGNIMATVVLVTASLTLFSPGLRAPVFLFAGLFLFNGAWLGFVHDWPKFIACMLAELGIAAAMLHFSHRGADWLVKSSYALAAAHLSALLGCWFDLFDPFYQYWDITIPMMELAQCIGIIVSQDWCFLRLEQLADHRRANKGKATWLAMTSVPR